MIYIYPYSKVSESARELANALGSKIIKRENSKFKWTPKKTVINWGASKVPYPCLNADVSNAINKLKAFKLFKEHNVSCPEFTENKKEALEWTKKHTVFARTTTTESKGKSIVVLNNAPNTDAPLYVKYIKKIAEYRVHIVHGKAIRVQQKLRKIGYDHNQIQNTANGYVFGDVKPSGVPRIPSLVETANKATKALALDFGGVDIIWNEHLQTAYVLEVNTAPGLCASTAALYAEAFRNAA